MTNFKLFKSFAAQMTRGFKIKVSLIAMQYKLAMQCSFQAFNKGRALQHTDVVHLPIKIFSRHDQTSLWKPLLFCQIATTDIA